MWFSTHAVVDLTTCCSLPMVLLWATVKKRWVWRKRRLYYNPLSLYTSSLWSVHIKNGRAGEGSEWERRDSNKAFCGGDKLRMSTKRNVTENYFAKLGEWLPIQLATNHDIFFEMGSYVKISVVIADTKKIMLEEKKVFSYEQEFGWLLKIRLFSRVVCSAFLVLVTVVNKEKAHIARSTFRKLQLIEHTCDSYQTCTERNRNCLWSFTRVTHKKIIPSFFVYSVHQLCVI